jgi:ribosomal protein L7/L12
MNANIPPEMRSAILELLAHSQKLEAIKLYRESTGASLAEAKDAIEHMETGAPQPSLSKSNAVNIAYELQRQGKIAAIKLYREQTGVGLHEAKLAVEEIARREGIKPRKTGCLGVIVLLIALVITLVLVAR